MRWQKPLHAAFLPTDRPRAVANRQSSFPENNYPPVGFHEIPFCATTRDQAVDQVIAAAADARPSTFRFVNAGTIHAAYRDSEYLQILRTTGTNFPDGAPLAALLNYTTPKSQCFDQVPGPWLFEQVLDKGRSFDLKHFFLGTTDRTLEKLSRNMTAKFPGLKIVQTYSPPFSPMTDYESRTQVEHVTRSKADIVWVALGTPKQDREALRIAEQAQTCTAAVGAAFDFSAGTVRVAPNLLRRLKLEWLFRLACEPRRLWRRYVFGNARFVVQSILYLKEFRRNENGTSVHSAPE